MPAVYMLDTNTVIALRGGDMAVRGRIGQLEEGDAVLSVVTYGELRVGIEKSDRRGRAQAMLEAILTTFPIQRMEASVAIAHGEIRADLERRGAVIGPNDLWIAAHARAGGLTLVTGNEREFRRVPGLAVENWVAARA